MKNTARHIELLDYIRAIAILTVMFDHTLTNIYGYESLPWAGWFRDLSVPVTLVYLIPFNLGQLGVAIFFFVSGFCIHLSFQQQGQKWSSFFIRRFFRIYPAYLAALIYFTLWVMQQTHLNLHNHHLVTRHTLEIPGSVAFFWKDAMVHLFLVHNFPGTTFAAIDGVFWTLAIEAQLYLLYPVVVWLVAKSGWRRTLFVLAAIEISIRATDGVTQTLYPDTSTVRAIAGFFSRSPFGFWFSWTLGAFVADAVLKKQPLPFRNASLFWWIVLSLACYVFRPLFPFSFLLFALMTAIIAGKMLSGAKSPIQLPAFSLKLLAKIGLWSYSIYLIHQPLLMVYANAVSKLIPQERHSIFLTYLLMLAIWLIIIPFAVLWYMLFELPGIGLGKRIIKKLDAPNAALFEPQRTQEKSRIGRGAFCLMAVALVIFAFGSFYLNTELKPADPVEGNNLAWSLATNPDVSQRNGALAVKLAQEACEETEFKQTIMVGTLAAAYAEAGKFDAAVSTAQNAIALARQNGDDVLLEKNEELLNLYRRHQAYHETH